MRYSILTDYHLWPPRHLSSELDDLVSGALRDPVVVAPEIEEQSRRGFFTGRDTPDIIVPLIRRDSLHLIGGHVSRT